MALEYRIIKPSIYPASSNYRERQLVASEARLKMKMLENFDSGQGTGGPGFNPRHRPFAPSFAPFFAQLESSKRERKDCFEYPATARFSSHNSQYSFDNPTIPLIPPIAITVV
eukprot:scaffold33712_cov73-Skeletonema_marinoi.AAC.1